MRTNGRAKVCLPVAGKPVIIRQLETFRAVGIESHIIVVGYHAEEVMRTVSGQFSGETWFAFQPENLGTGNAARAGAQLLHKMAHLGRVLVMPGDEIIETNALRRLMKVAEHSDADLAFMMADKAMEPSAGRVIFAPSGEPIASVEKFDSAKCQLLSDYFEATERAGELTAEDALNKARTLIGPDNKIALALGELYDALHAGHPLTRDAFMGFFAPDERFIQLKSGIRLTSEEIEKSKYVNVSVYLFKADALFEMLTQLTSNTAQREEYLTDAIAILHGDHRYKVVAEKLQNKSEVLAFNTPEELDALEAYLETNAPVQV